MNSILKRTALAITIMGLFYGNLVAQDQAPASGKSEATIGLAYYKKADQSNSAVATIKAKNKQGKFAPAVNANVNFYAVSDSSKTLLQSAVSDEKGEATITLAKGLPLNKDLAFTIVAKIENDKLYEDADETMTYKEVNLSLKANPTDTGHLATALVTEMDAEGKMVPVKDVEVKFYVQRLFGIMAASDENAITTDANGEASFKFPKGLPGDTVGAFSIVARIEDNDKFGNAENKAATSWGSVLPIEANPFPRAIWEPKAPIPLIMTLSILFGLVWCTYIMIVFQLRQIKKDGAKA